MKNKRNLTLLVIVLFSFSILNPTTAFAKTKKTRYNSVANATEAYAQTSSYDPPTPEYTPYKRATFVYSDPTSYLDEYAFIASIPANVFRNETQNLYTSPIIYGESKAGNYLLEDWKAYCNHWGGVSSLDFIGPYSDDYMSETKSYLETDNYTSIIADNPYEYANKIALRDWTNTTTAVVSPATTYFKTPEPAYSEFKGEFFNITEEYNINYWFGPNLGSPTPAVLDPPVESLHPYPNGSWTYYYVTHPGAAQISVHFENISLQEGWDWIYIYDENYDFITSYTGHISDVWTPPVYGDTVIIILYTDPTISDWGFRADSYKWWTYEPPFHVIHRNEWLNFTVPANITGITIANVELLNWTSAVGETLLTCFLIDPDGKVVDYDFSPGYGGYAWLMWDINERPRTTSENYTVAVYCHGFKNPENYGLIVGVEVYGFSGKPGNVHSYTVTMPENAEELDVWLSCNSTRQRASYLSMWLIDPEGNVFFPNYFEFTDTEYPPAPIYISNIGRLNAPYPTPGNWTLIVEAPPPYSLDMTVEYTIQYQIRLYNKEKEIYVEAAANSAVIVSLINAPLLYTENDTLPEETVKALRTLNVQNVILVNPAGIVSDAVKTAITEIGINITENLTTLKETILYIRGLSGETDLVLTVPTNNFFAPAALAGAFHGAPVITFKNEAKEIPTLADSTWGAQYYYHEFWGWSYYDMFLKAPPIHWMHQLSRIWSRWIEELDADAPGIESVLTVAPLTDVKPVFERAIAGVAKTGRMPGENAEEDVAFVNRAMLYPAIIYATPGYNVTMPTCVSYDYGIPDVRSDIPLDLVEPENYTVPSEYVYSVNGWENTTKAMENHNFTVEPHVGKYTVLDQLNNGTAFWYHSDHGGLGFVNDYLPFGQGVIGLWYEDPPDPQPKRGYEYNSATFAENASDPDQYYPYGAVYQMYGEPFSFVYGGELDRWLDNLHSTHTVFMDCYVGGSLLPLTMMRHGASSAIGDLRTGLLVDADWFCVKYAEEVMAGSTLGEAFVTAVTKAGYVYPENYFNMTLFSPVFFDYTVKGEKYEWAAFPYLTDGSNAFVLYGDPDAVIVDPNEPEPECVDPAEITVMGHTPDHATRSVSVTITAPSSGDHVGGLTTVDWTISLQNTVLHSCLLYIDGSAFDVTHLTSYSWNSTSVGDGTHTIEILVEDEAGNTGNALTTVVVDNTDPTVSIISPESNDVVRGILNVTFVTWDNNLSNASIIIDSDEPKNVTGATSFALNTTRLNDGTHTIKLLASDSAGNEAETSVTITVDNTIPTAEITNPTDGTELNGTITIQFSASDDNLYEVLLYVDQAMYNVTEENSYTWDTTTIGDGSHTIRLVATDQAENQVQDQITITTTNIEKTTQESYETGYLSGRNFGLEIGAPLGIIIGTIIAYAIAKKTKQGKKQT